MKIEHNNTELYYEVSGKGAPWVFLHGFLESSTMWKEIIPEFLETHTVILIDLPGHGQSGIISDVHSMELLATAVRSVLQHLNIPKASFIGHSMGGYVALAYADLYPSEVTSLVLINSTPAEDSIDRKQNRLRALNVVQQDPTTFIKLVITSLFSEESKEKYALEIKQLHEEALKFPLEGITASIKGMKDRKDRSSFLKNFDKKKYMICGKEDPILPVAESESWAKFCKIEPKIISGGHMSHIENRLEIVKILHFIE